MHPFFSMMEFGPKMVGIKKVFGYSNLEASRLKNRTALLKNITRF